MIKTLQTANMLFVTEWRLQRFCVLVLLFIACVTSNLQVNLLGESLQIPAVQPDFVETLDCIMSMIHTHITSV